MLQSMMRALFWSCLATWSLISATASASMEALKPNIVLILADDLGYGDVGAYGSKLPTPNLDRLASEGVRFTDFYVPQAVCSASRAGLMTGCYPNRIGILGALGPKAKTGLNAGETTLGELLKRAGYATAIYGKWHLGDHPTFLPLQHGFDHYFGLPYSNDMWPQHPTTTNYPPLPLIEQHKVVELMPDQTHLTSWYTERAVKFIESNRSRPFFLYLPHNMPHVPLFVSSRHKGKTGSGLYGDVIAEIDWSVGEILNALRNHGLDRKTLVVFLSDNGPWLSYGNHAGSAGPLREGKGTTFEGGVRVPFLARWPGKIPAGTVCKEMALSMDLFPTFGKLAGENAIPEQRIDGKDIWPLLAGTPGARSPHEVFYYYWGRDLQAVRSGPWKLHLPHPFHAVAPGADGKPGKVLPRQIGLALYNLNEDVGERHNVADANPEIVRQLQELAEQGRLDLGDSDTKHPGKNVRPPGRRPAAETL